jgi:Fe2+ transport system protein FeoA
MSLTTINIDAAELASVKPGTACRFSHIDGSTSLRKCLEDMGFTAGAELMVERKVRDSVIVRVRGTRVAIGGPDARRVVVTASA